MIYEEIEKKMRAIAQGGVGNLTADDKAYIRKTAADLGVQFTAGKSRCRACYIDAAILCYTAAKKKAAEEAAESDTRKYILVPDTDVYFGSVRVNEATLTDELAERIIARGFDKSYFVKCE